MKFALGQYYHEDKLHPIPPRPLDKDGAGVEEVETVVDREGARDSADGIGKLGSNLSACAIENSVASVDEDFRT